jgi:cytochrome P450 family 135
MADRFDTWVTQRYPATFRMRILGVGEVVVTRDPEAVRSLFTAPPGAVTAGEINRRVVPAVGPDSIMMLDGDRHLRMRRLLLPPFHGKALQGYEALIEQIVLDEIDTWPLGRPFALHPRMQAITLEVILAVVLGVSDRERRDRLRGLLPRVLEMNPVSVLLSSRAPWLFSGPVASLRPSVRARRETERLLREEIAAHRRDEQRHDDILAMLIASRDEDGVGLSDSELEGQLATLLLAGHETTATSLAWAFERLLRHPDAVARLPSEIDTGEGAYIEAAIKETMRTRPVVEAVWRVVQEPLELGRHLLPPGTIVAPVIRAIGREGHDDPADFRPERFLEGEPVPYGLIPFGGGVRRCLGASLATMEMRIVLRTVFDRCEIAAPNLVPEKVSRSRRFTASPSRGARATVTAVGRS